MSGYQFSLGSLTGNGLAKFNDNTHFKKYILIFIHIRYIRFMFSSFVLVDSVSTLDYESSPLGVSVLLGLKINIKESV